MGLSPMANDRSKFFFNVLALENILVALTREIGDGPCFLYIEFSWIGVAQQAKLVVKATNSNLLGLKLLEIHKRFRVQTRKYLNKQYLVRTRPKLELQVQVFPSLLEKTRSLHTYKFILHTQRCIFYNNAGYKQNKGRLISIKLK